MEPRDGCIPADHHRQGACFHCCESCNYAQHRCHFCGADLDHGSYSYENGLRVRHWLSDCRPDLVEHEPGEICTWVYDPDRKYNCYAYQDRATNAWTDEHEHFYPDGPMA